MIDCELRHIFFREVDVVGCELRVWGVLVAELALRCRGVRLAETSVVDNYFWLRAQRSRYVICLACTQLRGCDIGCDFFLGR